MRVLGITHKKNGVVRSEGDFLIFPTAPGANTYLNMVAGDEQQVKLLEEKGWKPKAVGFWVLKYKVEGDTLLIWLIDDDAKKRAIEAGKIKGVIEIRKTGPNLIAFADTTENVARFVASAGDSLFSKDAMRLERVK